MEKLLQYGNNDLINKFFDGRSENTSEVEVKAFFNNNLQNREKLKNLILEKLNGKVIFDGEIYDIRYYDTCNKEKSRLLKEQGIYLVRVRQIEEQSNKKYFLTIKKEGDSKIENEEYEKPVGKGIFEKLKKLGLKKIKESKKYRTEIEIPIKVNEEIKKVKIAIDKYTDETNKKLPLFIEIEAETKEELEIAIRYLKKAFPLDSMYFTSDGPKKLVKRKVDEKLPGFSLTYIRNLLLEAIVLSDEDFYPNLASMENDFTEDYILSNNKLFYVFYKYLRRILYNKTKSDKKESYYFHRIISNLDPKKYNLKKFDDKFDREYVGYMRAFILHLKKEINKFDIKKDKKQIEEVISNNLDKFLKILFVFDDSLTPVELEKVLNFNNTKFNKYFQQYENTIKKLVDFMEKDFTEIWKNFGEMEIFGKKHKIEDDRLIKTLLTQFSRAVAFTASKTSENVFNEEKIEKNLKVSELHQFEFLVRRFSTWINSPQKYEKDFLLLRNLFLEDFYHIYVLRKNNISFKKIDYDGEKFDQDFINYIFDKYKGFLKYSNQFLIKEKGPEWIEYFIKNLFSDSEIVRKALIQKYKKYNKEYTRNVMKPREKMSIEAINFDTWKNLKIEERIKLFIEKVIKVEGKSIDIKPEFLAGHKIVEIQKKFINYKFKKTKNKDFSSFKAEMNKKFNKLKRYFKNEEKLSLKYKILTLARNDIELFQLLVEWFQFNIKLSHLKSLKNSKLKIEDISLYSESFLERFLNRISDIIEDENLEIIVATPSAYVNVLPIEYILLLHDRIGNYKPINLLNNFSIKIEGKKFYLKDMKNLYIGKKANSYKDLKKFLEDALVTVRSLINKEQNEKDEYVKILKTLNFPIENPVYLKKLLELLKYAYKIVLPFSKQLNKQSVETTEIFANAVLEYIEKNQLYEKGKDYIVANPKSLIRIFEKAMINYGGYLEKVGDGARATFFAYNLEGLEKLTTDFIRFLYNNKIVSSVRIEDKIGNVLKEAKRENGYRDFSMVLVFPDGETVEIQFQIKLFYYIKTGNIKINKGIMNVYPKDKDKIVISNFNIREKLKTIKFDEEDKNTIIDYVKNNAFPIPREFCKLAKFDTMVIEELEKLNLIKEDGFNCDWTYNLERVLKPYPKLVNKLKKLDKILFSVANGLVAEAQIRKVMGWTE